MRWRLLSHCRTWQGWHWRGESGTPETAFLPAVSELIATAQGATEDCSQTPDLSDVHGFEETQRLHEARRFWEAFESLAAQ